MTAESLPGGAEAQYEPAHVRAMRPGTPPAGRNTAPIAHRCAERPVHDSSAAHIAEVVRRASVNASESRRRFALFIGNIEGTKPAMSDPLRMCDLLNQERRLDISCLCGRRDLIRPDVAVRRFGARTTLPELQRRLTCSQCGLGGPKRPAGITVRPCSEDFYAKLKGKGMGAG
jgi:hypothetical protein